MNGSSVMNTTATSLGIALYAPVVAWLVNGCPKPVPDAVSYGIVASIAPFLHLLYAWLSTRLQTGAKQ